MGTEALEMGSDLLTRVAADSQQSPGTIPPSGSPHCRLRTLLGLGSAACGTELPAIQRLGRCWAQSRYAECNIGYEEAMQESQGRILEPRTGPSMLMPGLSPYTGPGVLPRAAPRSRGTGSYLEASRQVRPADWELQLPLGMCTESLASGTYKEPEVGQEICGF